MRLFRRKKTESSSDSAAVADVVEPTRSDDPDNDPGVMAEFGLTALSHGPLAMVVAMITAGVAAAMAWLRKS